MIAILKLLDLIPGWIWAIGLAFVTVISGANHVRAIRAHNELATYKAEAAQALAKAEQEARARETHLRQQIDRIAANAAKRQAEQTRRSADVDRALDGLRTYIATLNTASPAPASPELAACSGQARTARELLGACAAEYRGVAQRADELAGQVTGLQEYAASVRP